MYKNHFDIRSVVVKHVLVPASWDSSGFWALGHFGFWETFSVWHHTWLHRLLSLSLTVLYSLFLSLISFSVLHSIDVISSSNRPLLFYSLIYSSLFLSLWFWRFMSFITLTWNIAFFFFSHFLFCCLILTLSVYSVTSSLWVSCFCLIVEALL